MLDLKKSGQNFRNFFENPLPPRENPRLAPEANTHKLATELFAEQERTQLKDGIHHARRTDWAEIAISQSELIIEEL